MTQRERPSEAEFTQAPARDVDAEISLPDALTVAIDGAPAADGKLPVAADVTFPASMTVAVDGAPAAGGKLPVDVGTPTVAISGAAAAGGKLPVDVGTPAVTVSGTPSVLIGSSANPDTGAQIFDGRIGVEPRPRMRVSACDVFTPANTSHAAGDVVGPLLTFANLSRFTPAEMQASPRQGSGTIVSVCVIDYSASATKFAGMLMFTAEDTSFTDDAVFSVSSGDYYAVKGIVSWTAADWQSHAAGAFMWKQVAIPYWVDGNAQLYAVMVTRETKTFPGHQMRVLLHAYID